MRKRTTIADIARECQVSITTISRVMNRVPGYCAPETEKRILEAVERLQYRPNPVARSLVKRRTLMIAVLIPDIYNHFFQEFYQGAEAYCVARGYKILLCNTAASEARELAYLEDLSAGVVDGILVSTLNGAENNGKLLELEQEKFPLVLVERYGDDLKDMHRVIFSNREAMEMSVGKLYQNGHRRIAYLSGPKDAYNARLRLEGYRAAHESLGLKVDENLIRYGDYKLESGYNAMRDLLAHEKFTAFAAANDLIAIGACRAIREAGMCVPDDISAVGFDGTLLTDLHQPPLDTVALGGCEMGQKSAECLLRLIENEKVEEKTIRFQPHLRAGGSIKKIDL